MAHQDGTRLQVAMDDRGLPGVRILQGAQHMAKHPKCTVEWRPLAEPVVQGAPAHERERA